MPTDKSPATLAEGTKRFSASLLHAAAKGKFSTHRAGIQKPSAASDAGGAANPVEVQYKGGASENIMMKVDSVDQEPLPSDRIELESDHVFNQSARKELLITAAAAKSLTRLYGALCCDPGSGPEVPAHIRTRTLDLLIRSSHQLANSLCEHVAGIGRPVPIYLRAKLLQQSAEFISEQWVRHGSIDTTALLEMGKVAFAGEVEGIDQNIVDLFHEAGEFRPADSKQISEARITEAVVRASWSLLRQVNHFDLRDYDSDLKGSSEAASFSFGRDPYSVAKDLTAIALSITKENELEVVNLDLATNWTQNSIDRASSLVRSEYRFVTDRTLRSSFKDDLLSEAAINKLNGLYDEVLKRVHARARNGFIVVEKNAIDAMSAASFRHYLPKKDHKQQAHTKQSAAITPAPAQPESVTTASVNHAAEPAKKRTPFSFSSRPRNA